MPEIPPHAVDQFPNTNSDRILGISCGLSQMNIFENISLPDSASSFHGSLVSSMTSTDIESSLQLPPPSPRPSHSILATPFYNSSKCLDTKAHIGPRRNSTAFTFSAPLVAISEEAHSLLLPASARTPKSLQMTPCQPLLKEGHTPIPQSMPPISNAGSLGPPDLKSQRKQSNKSAQKKNEKASALPQSPPAVNPRKRNLTSAFREEEDRETPLDVWQRRNCSVVNPNVHMPVQVERRFCLGFKKLSQVWASQGLAASDLVPVWTCVQYPKELQPKAHWFVEMDNMRRLTSAEVGFISGFASA